MLSEPPQPFGVSLLPPPQAKVKIRLEKVLEEITDILGFITWNSAQFFSRKVKTKFY